MSKHRVLSLIRQAALLLATKKVCNEESVFEWLKICYFAHNHGYLYLGFDGKDNVDLACIAYRTPFIKNDVGTELPEKEKGHILYVCAVASMAKNNLKLRRLMTWYLREHPEVSQVIYHYRMSKELKIKCTRNTHNIGVCNG